MNSFTTTIPRLLKHFCPILIWSDWIPFLVLWSSPLATDDGTAAAAAAAAADDDDDEDNYDDEDAFRDALPLIMISDASTDNCVAEHLFRVYELQSYLLQRINIYKQ